MGGFRISRGTNFILVFFLLCSYDVFAQEVIATQGDTRSNSVCILNYTIGELVTSFGTDGSNDLTQGFQQVFFEITKVEDYNIEMDVTIFPNPAVDQVTVQISNYSIGSKYYLYDSYGKELINADLTTNELLIKFNHFSIGTYFLVIKNKNQKLETFKIQKSH